jgi:hypothetical protein
LLPAPQRNRTRTRGSHFILCSSLFSFFLSLPPQLCGKQDAKPTGVLPLREYFLKEAKDEKKKSAGWDLLSVKEVIPPGNLPVRPRRVSALPAVRSQHTHTTHTHTHSLTLTHDIAERTVHSFKAETDKEKKEWMAILKKLTSPLPTVKPPLSSQPSIDVVTDDLRCGGGATPTITGTRTQAQPTSAGQGQAGQALRATARAGRGQPGRLRNPRHRVQVYRLPRQRREYGYRISFSHVARAVWCVVWFVC